MVGSSVGNSCLRWKMTLLVIPLSLCLDFCGVCVVGAPVHAQCAILDFMVESILPLFILPCGLIFNMNLGIIFILVVRLCFSDLWTFCPDLVFCLLT